MPLTPGHRLGPYEILGSLGAGGMGEVYRARDERLGRDVALKVLPADVAADAARLARFEREARTVAGLNHPNIVVLYSVEAADGVRFLTMELVEGQTLGDLITAGGLPVPRVLDLGIAIADALAAAHEKGVVHRDLKPANIMLTHDGRVKVLDFGLARVGEAAAPHDATIAAPLSMAGEILGTVPYMSPEQLKGRAVDARSDLFSLGIVLYELATGRRPFVGDTSAETISAILRDAPQPVTDVRRDAPRDLERIVGRCLEKDPEARFQTAKDVRNELRVLVREVESGHVARSARSGRPSKHRPWIFAAAALVLVAAGGLWLAGRNRPAVAPTVTSLAVLPFADLSEKKDQEYFSDGLAEEVLNLLAKIPDLKVMGRTSSFSFKGKNDDLKTIGQKLGVTHLLEGSVRRSGDRIRITAQLVNADDGFQLWSESYDRPLDDVFAVQDDIAKQVATTLRVTLLGGSDASIRTNPTAYDLVLQARFALRVRSVESIRKGRELLDRAIELSPNYAPAWGEMGLVHIREGELAITTEERQASREEARKALSRALELDPKLAVMHSRLATVQSNMWEFAAAEQSAARALAAEPRNPIVLGNTAWLYRALGRVDDAIALSERGFALDPLNANLQINAASSYLFAGNLEKAEAACRKALAISPDHPVPHLALGQVHLARREVDAARDELMRYSEIAGQPEIDRVFYGSIVAHTSGDSLASRLGAEEFERRVGKDDPATAAEVRAWRGDRDAAFEWLDKALAAHDPGMGAIKPNFFLAPLRSDPRWNALLLKIGLPVD